MLIGVRNQQMQQRAPHKSTGLELKYQTCYASQNLPSYNLTAIHLSWRQQYTKMV